MKTLPIGMQAHLDSGATTLCWCWRLTRRDNVKLGFTDHDRDVAFDGTTFEAAAGFTASEIKDSVGLNVDNLEVASAVTSTRLAETDLASGLYDDAKVEIFRVNWSDPTQRVLMRSGSLGEVKRAGTAFSAEVRGLAHYLQQPKGRIYQYACDADLGDGRCKINLALAAYKGAGAITAVLSPRRFEVSGLVTFANNFFSRGLLTFTSGAANATSVEVKQHGRIGSVVTLDLWEVPKGPLTVAQTFTLTAGCDKSLATCRTKFANAVNFRGFPHMPGNDFLTKISRPGG
jgi:uncharacterized phage protein (TIGR02218 family)